MKHWSEISQNPNDLQVKQWRSEALAKVRSPHVIKDRIAHLCNLARGRRVLDIGCVEHFAEAAEHQDWLHGHLARVAGSCLGVDVLDEAVRKLQGQGYNVRVADVTLGPLTERFEVIICGELIEHIGTAGPLFRNVAHMLEPGGVFALTTPFPWYFGWMVKNLFNGHPAVGSVDHVSWYDPGVPLRNSVNAMTCECASSPGFGTWKPRRVSAR